MDEDVQKTEEINPEEIKLEEVNIPAPEKIVEAEIIEEPKNEEASPVEVILQTEDPNVVIVRTEETGDKVYAVKNEKRYWVRNVESLKKMGFHLGQEKKIPFSELLRYPEGEPLDLTLPNAVFPWDKPEPEKSTSPTMPHKIWS
jgi:hypothetical protein